MSGLKVLLVDRDSSLLGLLHRYLSKKGAAIEYSDGNALLERFSKERLDLLVIDPVLKNTSGLGVLRQLATLPASQRPRNILVLSSILAPQSSQHSTDRVTYLPKPLPESKLDEYLRQVFTHRDLPGIESPKPVVRGQPKIDASALMVFVHATVDAFKRYAKTEILEKRVVLRDDGAFAVDLSAVLPFEGEEFLGLIALEMNREFLARVMQRIQGTTAPSTELCGDGIVEILEQIYGTARTELSRTGVRLGGTRPIVFAQGPVGEKDQIEYHSIHACVSFRCDLGAFRFRIGFSEKPG